MKKPKLVAGVFEYDSVQYWVVPAVGPHLCVGCVSNTHMPCMSSRESTDWSCHEGEAGQIAIPATEEGYAEYIVTRVKERVCGK